MGRPLAASCFRCIAHATVLLYSLAAIQYAHAIEGSVPMNGHVRWRLDRARTLSAQLRRFAGIQAIVVGGSVAPGYSDAYSDLELLLYWDQAPSPDLQHALVADLRAEFRYPTIDPGHDSALFLSRCPWRDTPRIVYDSQHIAL